MIVNAKFTTIILSSDLDRVIKLLQKSVGLQVNVALLVTNGRGKTRNSIRLI